LMMVTLACVLCGEPLFGLLLEGYLCVALWCLATCHLYREQGRALGWDLEKSPLFSQAASAARSPAPADGASRPAAFSMSLGRLLRWTAAVLVLGMFLFFLAPRRGNMQWDPLKLSATAKALLRTGMEPGIDLNRVGQVQLSEEPAFEVTIFDKNGLKTDMPSGLRWRVETLDYYEAGRWLSWPNAFDMPRHLPAAPGSPPYLPPEQPDGSALKPPPDLQDQQYYLSFKVKPLQDGGLIIAEPIDRNLGLGMYPTFEDKPYRGKLFHDLPGGDNLLTLIRLR